MMPGSMNPRPAGMGMNPMAPNNYQYQGGMGPGQGQMAAMSMQGRPPAPPQHNPSMYGQMPGMVQTNTFVGGQPGKCHMTRNMITLHVHVSYCLLIQAINYTLPSTIRVVISTLICTSMASNSMCDKECY